LSVFAVSQARWTPPSVSAHLATAPSASDAYPLAAFVAADAVADLRRADLPVGVEQADGPDDPAGRAVQHHEVDARSFSLRPVHAVGEPPCHVTRV